MIIVVGSVMKILGEDDHHPSGLAVLMDHKVNLDGERHVHQLSGQYCFQLESPAPQAVAVWS